ncbi:MAG TPA: DUF2461 domain-containing protein [Terracidiphilus sp.]|jgi:uncharacterized protein (TIGR02453 family)
MAIVKTTAPAPADPCFRSEALKFLRNLARHNDREWFTPRKAEFEELLRQPMLSVVRKITDAMLDFAPDHIRPAEKSLFRIYRDTRFSNDKRPYKTHMAAWWTHTGLDKTSGAGYYFHVSAKEVIIAAGSYMPEKEQLAAIRHWLLDHHAEFRKLLGRPAIKKAFTEFEGNTLSRPPKGFPGDHPALDLVKCRQWGLSATLPAEAALDPRLAATVTRYFRLAAPLVDALNTPIAATLKTKKKVLFGLH